MTSPKTAELGAVLYEDESAASSWCESSAFSSPVRLQTLGAVDLSGFNRNLVEPGITKQYSHEGIQMIRGPFDGAQFTVRMLLTGSTSDTSSETISASALATFLSGVLGNTSIASSNDGDAVSGGASTATSVNVSDATGFAAGSLAKYGVLGDGGGAGQFALVTDHSGSVHTLGTALPAGPGDTDAVYSPELVYPNESPESPMVGRRFKLLTANRCLEARGCFPVAIRFQGLGNGELPIVEVDYQASYWTDLSSGFPDATATGADAGAIVSSGSMYLQDEGTATRATIRPVSFSLNIDLDVAPLRGNDGTYEGQVIQGAVRRGAKAEIEMTVDAQATGTQDWVDLALTEAGSRNFKTGIYTLNKDVAILFNRLRIADTPTQQDADGLNRETLRFQAMTHLDGGSALERAAYVLAMA